MPAALASVRSLPGVPRPGDSPVTRPALTLLFDAAAGAAAVAIMQARIATRSASPHIPMPRHIEDHHELCLDLLVSEVLTQKEVWSAQQRWRKTFARHLHAETRKWVYRGFDWHVFSWGFCEHLSGKHAIKALEEALPASVLVHSDCGDTHSFGFRGKLGVLATPNPAHDIVISDPRFRWTFVLTHEAHCGPYLSRNDHSAKP